MKITLVNLTLRNFKGARDVSVDFGNHMRIRGKNETGKTTLFDAFLWLLFDKDSQDRKNFEVKTKDADGNVLHFLDHEVTGTLLVDGKTVTLRKVMKEDWVTPRGSAEKEFAGHKTKYFIDGVPVPLNKYADYVSSLIDEKLFKLLTNPGYFNEQMSWQERRKMLLDVCGDVSDDEVISSDDKLSPLRQFLQGRAIEDHRKVVQAELATINKQREQLPVRIDEAERSKPDTDGLNEIELQTDIEGIKSKIADKEAEQTRLQSGGEVAEKEKRLREVEGELLQIKNAAQSDVVDQITAQRRLVSGLEDELDQIARNIGSNSKTIAANQETIQELEAKVQKLRDEWTAESETELADTGVVDTCPTCGQALPEGEVLAAIEKAHANFKQRRSEKLESITNEANKIKVDISQLEQANAQLSSGIGHVDTEVKRRQQSLEFEKTKLEQLQSQVTDPTKSLEYRAKELERQAVVNKIAGLRQSVLDDVTRVRGELMDLRDELRRKETLLARFEQVRKLDVRIDELKQEERTLAGEYERLAHQVYLMDEFTRAKVSMFEERINSKFKYARFQMFENLLTGGLKELCETLYKGVSYSKGLNTGAKILVGLDIIMTLQDHFGISVPVWVDNRESLTEPLDVSCQLIELVADGSKKKLQIENLDDIKEAV